MKREHLFVRARGINGSFPVVGSVLVPILSVLLGLPAVLLAAAGTGPALSNLSPSKVLSPGS